jgi:Flp pilus assembly protein TadG
MLFVGPFFIALVTGIFYIGMTYLGQAGLETVAEGASRMLLTGRAQTVRVTNASGGTDVGMSAADFKTPSATA